MTVTITLCQGYVIRYVDANYAVVGTVIISCLHVIMYSNKEDTDQMP